MNIMDVIIILIILSGGVVGFKNGLTKQLVSFFGFIIVLVLSFLLKNFVSEILYTYLPFFKFGGILKGVTVLNIALYEVVAFLLVFSLLMFIFRLLLGFTSIFEKILKFTIILGIPSKILGAIVGMIEYVFVAFIVVYAFSLPIFRIEGFENSKLREPLLTKIPILSNTVNDTLTVFDEFGSLRERYDDKTTNATEFNLETLDLLLKYNIVTVDSVDKLVEKDKLQIDNIESVLKKYR